jgi:hypothetical protein
MDGKGSDQEWQQLQAHIQGFFGRALRNDVQRIEYRPQFIAQLLGMPSEHHRIAHTDGPAAIGNFGRKEDERE